MTNLDRIIILGEGMHGSVWRRPVATILGVDPKLVRMWIEGVRYPSDRHVQELRRVAESDLEELQIALHRTADRDPQVGD